MQSITEKGEIRLENTATQGREKRNKKILHPSSSYDTSLPLIYSILPRPRPKSKSRSRQGRISVLISYSSNSSSLLFFVERIARLASYACRVGLDLPSSYLGLEWELDGIDGPISYYIVLRAVLYMDRWRRRRRYKEEDIVVYLPPLPYVSPGVL